MEDIRLLSNILRGRAALSTWDITALIKDELLAKVLLPQIAKLRSEEFRGNRELLRKMEDDVTQEMQRTFSTWGITLDNFVINWGLTEPEIIELDNKRKQREEEVKEFSKNRQLADMRRNLEIDLAHVDNLKQLKIAEAKGDEDLKAVYVAAEVERATILYRGNLDKAQIDKQIKLLDFDIERQRIEIDRLRKEIDLDIKIKDAEAAARIKTKVEDDEAERVAKLFKTVQDAKIKRKEMDHQHEAQQTDKQADILKYGMDKGVVDNTTIQQALKNFTVQKAINQSDAMVDSLSKADSAKANIDTFKDAEDRERKHQVDMTGQSAKMMESAKQNVPETLVQGGGITPKVNLSIPAGQPGEQGLVPFTICPYCGKKLKLPKTPNFCPYCEEKLVN